VSVDPFINKKNSKREERNLILFLDVFALLLWLCMVRTMIKLNRCIKYVDRITAFLYTLSGILYIMILTETESDNKVI
jgi:hypothetical protein